MNSSVLVQSDSIFTGLQVLVFAAMLQLEEVYAYVSARDFEFEYLIINDKEYSIVCH